MLLGYLVLELKNMLQWISHMQCNVCPCIRIPVVMILLAAHKHKNLLCVVSFGGCFLPTGSCIVDPSLHRGSFFACCELMLHGWSHFVCWLADLASLLLPQSLSRLSLVLLLWRAESCRVPKDSAYILS